MIWSAISGEGNGRLYVVKSVVREDQYKDVLQNRLIPQLEKWFPNGEPYIFMQDGAPCRTALSIKAFWQNKISLCWIGRKKWHADPKGFATPVLGPEPTEYEPRASITMGASSSSRISLNKIMTRIILANDFSCCILPKISNFRRYDHLLPVMTVDHL
ncbi:uncharacterized protein TNCV_1561751 [Trichonephila clavipes]|nr:uncharacterized protein TNCV_1561751 [Trichonephila clavipes]